MKTAESCLHVKVRENSRMMFIFSDTSVRCNYLYLEHLVCITGVVFRVWGVVVTRSKDQEVLRRNKESRREISVETFCEVSIS